MNKIVKILQTNQDKEYQNFTSKLIPNIDKNKIIGVRLPVIRKIAKEIVDEEDTLKFLQDLPHQYHEENILHGILLTIKYQDIDLLLSELDKFLKYTNSWMITDSINPKLFKKYPDKVYKHIIKWLNSNHEYTIRFGIVSLLQFYLDDSYRSEELAIISKIESNYYYVNMAIAWFYSIAIIKKYHDTIKYFEERKLNKWIHNKSLEKAIESYRLNEETKQYLKSLKIK